MNASPASADRLLPPARHVRRGLSIVELLIVVLVLAVLATAALTYSGSGTPELLEAAAECVIGDLELARSLAVSNSSNYRITFDTSQSQYSLRHAGSNAALDILPASPFHRASDGGKCLTAELADLPSLEGDVQLLAVQKDPASPVDVTDVEFDPLGSTTRTEETIIWLAAGHGSQRRYLSIRINPTTGLAQSGDPQPQQPAGVVDVLAQAVLGP